MDLSLFQPIETLRTEGDLELAGQQTAPAHTTSALFRDRLALNLAPVVALVILGVAFLLVDLTPLYHTDVWAHMAIGRWIVEHGRLPAREPLSAFSDQTASYYNHCWLLQVVMYLSFRAGEWLAGGDAICRTEGGVELLRAGFGLLVMLRFLALCAAMWRNCGSLAIACLGLAVTLAASTGHIAVARPQVVGELCFASVLMALSRPVPSRLALVGVPLLMAAWANTHGSYVLGLALLAIFLGGRALEVAREGGAGDVKRVTDDPRSRRLLSMLSASAIAVLLNPRGPMLYWHTLHMGTHPNMATVSEWEPMGLMPNGWWRHYFALAGLLIATRLLSPRRSSPTEILLLVFALFPPFQKRWMVWWVMVAPWIMTSHWAAIAQSLPWEWVRRRGQPSWRKAALAVQVFVAAALVSTPVRWLVHGYPEPLDSAANNGTPWRLAETLRTPEGPASQRIPALDRALREHYPGGRFRGNIIPAQEFGDYLVWALPAEIPVLAYTHVHVFSHEYWSRYRLARFFLPGWREFLDSHRVNLVVVEADRFRERNAVIRNDPAWLVVVDESGDRSKRYPGGRMLIALRKSPL